MKKTKNHNWKKCEHDKRKIDEFAYDRGFHNGRKCLDCGLEFCVHCYPELLKSKCGETTKSGSDDRNLDRKFVSNYNALRGRKL